MLQCRMNVILTDEVLRISCFFARSYATEEKTMLQLMQQETRVQGIPKCP